MQVPPIKSAPQENSFSVVPTKNNLPLPSASKIQQISHSKFNEIKAIFDPLRTVIKFIAKRFQFFSDYITSVFQRFFPNENQEKANRLGIGSYQGDRLENAERFYKDGTSGITTIQELLKGEKDDGNRDKGSETLTHPLNGEKVTCPRQFYVDISREYFALNGKLMRNKKEFTKYNADESERKNNVTLFEISKKLEEQFGKQSQDNIGYILTQSSSADILGHLMYRIKSNESEDLIYPNSVYTTYGIEDHGESVHLTIETLFALRDQGFKDKDIGYITAQRRVIISKEDLSKDWAVEAKELDKVAPSLKVVDYYSRYAQTPGAANRHLHQLVKNNQSPTAKRYGIESYRGEVTQNLHRIATYKNLITKKWEVQELKQTGRTTAQELLKGVDSKGEPDRPTESVWDPEAQLELKFLKNFLFDINRIDQITIAGQEVYGKEFQDKKALALKVRKQVGPLLEQSRTAFMNLSALMTQATYADLSNYIGLRLPHTPLQVENVKNETKWDIREGKNNTITLTANLVFSIGPQEPHGTLGFIATQRTISLSKEDLKKYWSREKELSEVAKSLKVTDYISPFSIDVEKAKNHLKRML